MKINWFPGHMRKAIDQIKDSIKNVDSIIYMLDARAPYSSINPELTPLIANKPTLYILNKADLTDKRKLSGWKDFFEKDGNSCIYLNSLNLKSAKLFEEKLTKINSTKIETYKNKGAAITIKALVVGIPNTGKSTLINSFSGRKKTETSGLPGTTRVQQLVKISKYISVIDTPGILYPNLDNQETAKKLAMLGSIKAEIIDKISLAKEVIKLFEFDNLNILNKRYNLDIGEFNVKTILEAIANSRGCLVKGGLLNLEKAAKIILTDFRKGYLGDVMLDSLCDVNMG